ncbi:hypothetical protein ATANTOWER_010140 [Ataeniobius toweri]|uniref:LRRK2 ARM repeat domain-containing protein n=1 Tax=Ataeniobius toweri TaxID=208326 RepID=A0ABU7BXR1_9TELE|nr:hypothetical protein [Ataeniobius toweri]
MDNREELAERLKKLLVRLKTPQEDRQLSTLIQILKDLLSLARTEHAAELFEDKDVHLPLTVVLSSYMSSKGVQQVGLSLLCQLFEICPNTLEELTRPLQASREWEILGVHQQILKALSQYITDPQVTMFGLRALAVLLRSAQRNLDCAATAGAWHRHPHATDMAAARFHTSPLPSTERTVIRSLVMPSSAVARSIQNLGVVQPS